MDVKTMTFYELEQKLRYADDEIKRLKSRIAELEYILAIEQDTDPAQDEQIPALDPGWPYADGEVLDGEH